MTLTSLLPKEPEYILDVAVPCVLPHTLSYTYNQPVLCGSRVEVPFQNRALLGIVLACCHKEKAPPSTYKLRPIKRVVDPEPLLSPSLLQLADWISRYYLYPIGEVCKAMLPASQKTVTKVICKLTEKGQRAQQAGEPGAELLAAFGRKVELSRPTLRKKLQLLGGRIEPLLQHKWVVVAKSKGVKTQGKKKSADFLPEAPVVVEAAREKPALTLEQAAAVEQVSAEYNSSSPQPVWLLHGVTGSGKTEVYLRLIEKMLETSPQTQALVLVPEIALTPQMIEVFTQRFQERVAVVHSALSASIRWQTFEEVKKGAHRILIGPRSAIFAGFHKLGLIIVDEEHDSSYKQSSQFQYHARDVAVVRAKLDNVPLILGSATPSLESYYNATQGKYRLLRLSQRANQQALPQIQVIERLPENRAIFRADRLQGGFQGQEEEAVPIASEIFTALAETLAQGEQAIVVVNRRGYAHYLYDVGEKSSVLCPHCSISLTLHKKQQKLRCHYCEYATTLQRLQQERSGHALVAIGFGSQRTEEALQQHFPQARIARLDSDVADKAEVVHGLLQQFRRREIDILVGTQMVAKGHDFPTVTLTVLWELDQIMNLPDFRSGERTFQLMVQAAGRSGRGNFPGRVLLQTMRAEHPIVQCAASQDYGVFADRELQFRKKYRYPPFSKQVFIEYTSADLSALLVYVSQVEAWIERYFANVSSRPLSLRVLGPVVPSVDKLYNRYRRTVLITGDTSHEVRGFAERFVAQGPRLTKEIRMTVNVDPQSLL